MNPASKSVRDVALRGGNAILPLSGNRTLRAANNAASGSVRLRRNALNTRRPPHISQKVKLLHGGLLSQRPATALRYAGRSWLGPSFCPIDAIFGLGISATIMIGTRCGNNMLRFLSCDPLRSATDEIKMGSQTF